MVNQKKKSKIFPPWVTVDHKLVHILKCGIYSNNVSHNPLHSFLSNVFAPPPPKRGTISVINMGHQVVSDPQRIDEHSDYLCKIPLSASNQWPIPLFGGEFPPS